MKNHANEPQRIRCAIYTRKSTDEGWTRNSIPSTRSANRARPTSPARSTSDGSATRPTTTTADSPVATWSAPALLRLLADIEAGKVDCVVVYKVDRLSRSLMDFCRIMDVFEKHGVSFVSVTQAFNTNTSMGRLMLNVLLSFAQFEREIISERTRDKMAAARRKGEVRGRCADLGLRRRPSGVPTGRQRARGGTGPGHLPHVP